MNKFHYFSKIVKGDKLELIRDNDRVIYYVNNVVINSHNMSGLPDDAKDNIFDLIFRQVKHYIDSNKGINYKFPTNS